MFIGWIRAADGRDRILSEEASALLLKSVHLWWSGISQKMDTNPVKPIATLGAIFPAVSVPWPLLSRFKIRRAHNDMFQARGGYVGWDQGPADAIVQVPAACTEAFSGPVRTNAGRRREA